MTPEAALHSFLSGFGIPAYAAASTPDQADFPYITYVLAVSGGWDAGEVAVRVDVWYRTESEAAPNAKVREMYLAIGAGGVTVPCDWGMLWIKRGSPWAQAVGSDSGDDMVKHRYVNIDVEYLVTG